MQLNSAPQAGPTGPAGGLPDTHVGTFSVALMSQAKQNGWIVISMKNDWNRIFAFDK
jgi:hypothetical protein